MGGKDDRMGRVEIDLRELSREVPRRKGWREIRDGEKGTEIRIFNF